MYVYAYFWVRVCECVCVCVTVCVCVCARVHTCMHDVSLRTHLHSTHEIMWIALRCCALLVSVKLKLVFALSSSRVFELSTTTHSRAHKSFLSCSRNPSTKIRKCRRYQGRGWRCRRTGMAPTRHNLHDLKLTSWSKAQPHMEWHPWVGMNVTNSTIWITVNPKKCSNPYIYIYLCVTIYLYISKRTHSTVYAFEWTHKSNVHMDAYLSKNSFRFYTYTSICHTCTFNLCVHSNAYTVLHWFEQIDPQARVLNYSFQK